MSTAPVAGSQKDEDALIAVAMFGEGGGSGGPFAPVSFEDVASRLSDALELMVGSSARWALKIETAGGRYVQFLAPEDGCLVAECVSNSYLPAEAKLSEDDVELLAELGWGWPSPPKQVSWRTVEFDAATMDSAVLAVHTQRRCSAAGTATN
jgi:hypothetical protein